MRAKADVAFEVLFFAEHDRCERVARRITGDAGLAEQLASEAFARAWASWTRLRLTGSPGAWVMRVTVNLAIDATRRGVPHPELVPAPLVDDVVATHVALAEALRRLPARQRDAVTLRYLADLGEAETASVLGVTVGTVKTHVHRGLAALRTHLEEDQSHARA